VDEIPNALNVRNGSAYSILHDRLDFRKVCASWVPKNLSVQHKAQRLEISSKNLASYRREGDGFLQQIITADETSVHHNEAESRAQGTVWKQPSSTEVMKLKRQPTAGKIMLTLFWVWKV
jgi:hypothetical protein